MAYVITSDNYTLLELELEPDGTVRRGEPVTLPGVGLGAVVIGATWAEGSWHLLAVSPGNPGEG